MQMPTTEGWPYFMRKCLHEMPPETTTRKTTTTQSDEAAQHNGIHSGHYNASGADAGPHLWNVRLLVSCCVTWSFVFGPKAQTTKAKCCCFQRVSWPIPEPVDGVQNSSTLCRTRFILVLLVTNQCSWTAREQKWIVPSIGCILIEFTSAHLAVEDDRPLRPSQQLL